MTSGRRGKIVIKPDKRWIRTMERLVELRKAMEKAKDAARAVVEAK